MLARLSEEWNRRLMRLFALGLIVGMVAMAGCADDDDDDDDDGALDDDGDDQGSGGASGTIRGEGSPGWGWLGSLAAMSGMAGLVAWKRHHA